MATRSQFLQIRVSPAEKAVLKRLAAAAGQGMSSYVLARAVPRTRLRLEGLVGLLGEEEDRRLVLAELNDLLTGLAPVEFDDAVGHVEVGSLPPFVQNYVAAMVEQAAAARGVAPPAWVSSVWPLEWPHFDTPLPSLRLHLLQAAPVAFKRRNIFIDSSLGDRV